MVTETSCMIIRTVLDFVGVALIALFLYVCIHIARRFILERWVVKAVNAAEVMFAAPEHSKENSQIKKDWVRSFLKDNGFTTGFSEEVVDTFIEAAVNSMNIQQISSDLDKKYKTD